LRLDLVTIGQIAGSPTVLDSPPRLHDATHLITIDSWIRLDQALHLFPLHDRLLSSQKKS